MSLLSIINKEKFRVVPGCTGDLISTTDLGTYLRYDGDVSDSSGNANNGAVNGSVSYVSGHSLDSGDAVFINGSPNRITIPQTSTSTPQNNTISVSAWVYFTGSAVGGHHVYSVTTGGNYFRFVVRDSIGDILVTANGSNKTFSNGGFTLNEWHHVVVTYQQSANQVKAYVDGVQIGTTQTTSGSINATASPMIGALTPGSNANTYMIGYMDELSVWQRVLSATEIADLANATCPLIASGGAPAKCAGYAISNTDLVSYVNFNNTLVDQEGILTLQSSGPVSNLRGYIGARNVDNGSAYFTDSGQFEIWDFPAEMQITGDKNWSMWFAPVIDGVRSVLLTTDQTFVIKTEDNTDKIEFIIIDSSDNLYTVTTTNDVVEDGVWKHISVNYTYASGLVEIYVDGVLEGSGTIGSITPKNTSSTLGIGAIGASRGSYTDELSIWDRKLLSTEIQTLAGYCPLFK